MRERCGSQKNCSRLNLCTERCTNLQGAGEERGGEGQVRWVSTETKRRCVKEKEGTEPNRQQIKSRRHCVADLQLQLQP